MISHKTAQRIASEWHGGQSSPLYALASTGAIVKGATDELGTCLYVNFDDAPNRADLENLLAYVNHYGRRPAVPNWYARTIANS